MGLLRSVKELTKLNQNKRVDRNGAFVQWFSGSVLSAVRGQRSKNTHAHITLYPPLYSTDDPPTSNTWRTVCVLLQVTVDALVFSNVTAVFESEFTATHISAVDTRAPNESPVSSYLEK